MKCVFVLNFIMYVCIILKIFVCSIMLGFHKSRRICLSLLTDSFLRHSVSNWRWKIGCVLSTFSQIQSVTYTNVCMHTFIRDVLLYCDIITYIHTSLITCDTWKINASHQLPTTSAMTFTTTWNNNTHNKNTPVYRSSTFLRVQNHSCLFISWYVYYFRSLAYLHDNIWTRIIFQFG